MERSMLLLLLLLMGSWAEEEIPEPDIPLTNGTTSLPISLSSSLTSLPPSSAEAPDFNSSISSPAVTSNVKDDHHDSEQIQTLQPPTPDAGKNVSDSGTSPTEARTVPATAEVAISLSTLLPSDVENTTHPVPQNLDDATQHSTVSLAPDSHGAHTVMDGTTVTSAQATTSETAGLSVITAVDSPEASTETRGHSDSTTSNFLGTSSKTHLTTSSTGISGGPSSHSTSVATGSQEPPKRTSPTIAWVTPPPAQSSMPTAEPQQNRGSLLWPVLVALLVVIVLVVLLVLWRRRQKHRTGALTLSGGGKRNGAVDAWAGPAQVTDEEAPVVRAPLEDKADKDPGLPDGAGSGRRPTLTTFFGRRKSRQGSVVMEELKPLSAPSQEEEPLVSSEEETVESPTSEGPSAGDSE